MTGSAGSLILKSVTREDAGTYKCEALDFDAGPEVELTKTLNFNVHCEYQCHYGSVCENLLLSLLGSLKIH